MKELRRFLKPLSKELETTVRDRVKAVMGTDFDNTRDLHTRVNGKNNVIYDIEGLRNSRRDINNARRVNNNINNNINEKSVVRGDRTTTRLLRDRGGTISTEKHHLDDDETKRDFELKNITDSKKNLLIDSTTTQREDNNNSNININNNLVRSTQLLLNVLSSDDLIWSIGKYLEIHDLSSLSRTCKFVQKGLQPQLNIWRQKKEKWEICCKTGAKQVEKLMRLERKEKIYSRGRNKPRGAHIYVRNQSEK